MAFEQLKGKMDVSLYMLCSFIVFIFVVTSAPVSQFRGKGVRNEGAPKMGCVTVWGLKNKCTDNNYDLRPADMKCNKAKQIFQATEAFYVIASCVSLVSCILCGLFFLGIRVKVVLMVLAFVEICFALIPWALMTAVWYQDYCNGSDAVVNPVNGMVTVSVPFGKTLRKAFRPSAGYGLTITAWAIQVIGTILLFVA